ncbi:heavy metal transporter [Streptomyces sp. NPDC088387]|uniref:heavy metal transporter n=1 Tax=Streptomyces sp. NPDC088387 TaxID=3365859 RepID=UPI0038198D70
MSAQSPSPKRRGRLLRFGAAFVVLLAVAGYLVVQYVTGAGGSGCRVVSSDGDGTAYEFTPEQAVNAATITAVGTARGLPERAVTIALATAMQESALRNIEHGDRDSLGLFQQRPSQGWGTEQEIMDPTYSAGMFYEHLEKVRGYEDLPLTVAAQEVQRSGFPTAYAKHEPDALLLANAFTGRSAATLTCAGLPEATQTQGAQAQAVGPDAVRSALVRDFGQLQQTGAEVSAGAQSSPSPSPTGVTAETSGRTVTVPVSRETNAADGSSVEERGWQLAHWAVANASDLRIERVSYAGREWNAGTRDDPWVDSADTSRDAVRIVTGR